MSTLDSFQKSEELDETREISALEKVLLESTMEEPTSPEERVYVNRKLPMSFIKAIGFDLDLCLVSYTDEQNRFVFDDAKRRYLDVIDQRIAGISDDKGKRKVNRLKGKLNKLTYDPSVMIRSLVVDTENGNILKLNKFKEVVVAYHGKKRLGWDDLEKLYLHDKINIERGGRFRACDTHFELVNLQMYSFMVEMVDKLGLSEGKNSMPEFSYSNIFDNIKYVVDQSHDVTANMKQQVMKNPGEFVVDEPGLAETLKMWKDAGKKLFVVTASDKTYTEFMLSYLFDGKLEGYDTWRDYFDVVVPSAKKPRYFTSDKYQEEVLDELDVDGKEVLYFGDHTYGDVVGPQKKMSRHRTGMVCADLEKEIVKSCSNEVGCITGNIIATVEEREKYYHQRHEIIQTYKTLNGNGKSREWLEKNVRELDKKISICTERLSELRKGYETFFNPQWGSLFHIGYGDLTRFSYHVVQFACVYTTKISNFLNYRPDKCFRQHEIMPHEIGNGITKGITKDNSNAN